MLNIIFSKRSAKFFKNLLPKHKKQIQAKLKKMQENPSPPDKSLLKGEKEQYWRVDIGEYRIIYQFNEINLTIYVIGKRNDGEVYKSFFR